MSLFFYFLTFAINLWHRNFVTADVTAVFVSIQHGGRLHCLSALVFQFLLAIALMVLEHKEMPFVASLVVIQHLSWNGYSLKL